MQHTTPEAVTASEGESAFILQLRPAFPPGADPDALSGQIDQFLKLYLEAAHPEQARCARLEALTWAVSAPPSSAGAVEQVRADLAETLFGRDDGENVRLVRQGRSVDPSSDSAASDAGSGSPEDAGAYSEPGPDDPYAGWEPAHSSAATRAAMDDASDVLELDAPDLDIIDGDVFDVDSWSIDAPALAETAPGRAPPPPFDAGEAFGGNSAEATPGPGDVAAELAAFRAEMREIAAGIPAASGSEALDRFRAELDTITGALGQRVDGAAQRIETAAERVTETAASLPDAERMADAVERAEASAQLMESSVREAVEALTAALKAMNAAPGSGQSQSGLGA